MSEQQEGAHSRPQQGADAAAATAAGPVAATAADAGTDGEQMARRLVQDVAAYEVDPPPPARAEPES